jgi:anti-sigma factor ChrR (cupin superfamily)
MPVRMEPGTSYPRHRHKGVEEGYVLEGDLHVGDEAMKAGDCQRAETESIHAVQSTESGCLLRIVSSTVDELV